MDPRRDFMKDRFFRLSAMRLAAAVLLVHVILAPFAVAAMAEDTSLQARHLAERAQQTLETFANAREMEAFRNLIRDARGVFVSPQVLKGAFVFGASGGSGVFVARDRLRQQWVGPAFYTIGGISFGLQIGGSASEVILLAMTDRGVNALMESSFKLGADVGVAVGPVGIGAAASTANLSADIISFSRSKGLYGGVSVDGAIVKTRGDLNEAYYRGITTPVDILIRKSVSNPHARSLLQTVSVLSGGPAPQAEPQNTVLPKQQEIEEESAKPRSEIKEEPLTQ
jgi:SH3 domain-containing YSC84-like protein 1